MENDLNERTRKSSRKSRQIQTRRRTSRMFDLILSSFNAAKYGNIDELVLISKSLQSEDEYKLFIGAKDKEGNTLILKCIHGAAARQPEPHSNFFECIKFLISAGIDVNSQDHLFRTALHWSVLYGRLDFLDVLQAAGGDLLILDNTGLSPLHLAIGIKSEKLRDKFIDYICSSAPKELLEVTDRHGRNPLFLALTVFAVKTFEKLLIAKVNPDSPGPDGRKIIIHAIEKGQGKFIELLLRYGASLTTKDPDGFSVVHLAACQENPESVFVLTEMLNKTLLNVKDHLGRTPLIYACLMGFDKNVELLLSKKIWILDQDNDGKTALHHTISNTHCGCVELLCKENKKIVHIADNEGHTPAHDSVITGNLLIFNCLLKYGSDVHYKDYGGHSLIHWTAAYGTMNCFERLLECEAGLEEVDNHGASPLHYGCQKDNDEKLTNARIEIIQILLQRGVKLTVTDAEGRRPIHWAATSGNPAAFKILLKHGDDVNAQTSQEKMTPLHVCAVQGHLDVVNYLLKQIGIEINAQDQQKCTPLFYACSAGHSNVAEILLRAGADLQICNDVGESPSHTAAMFGSVECLQLLFNSGANLSCTNDQKDTPLHDAAGAGKKDAVKFLIKKGCPLTVRNLTGATPLHYAVAEGHIKITEMLLENRAHVNALVTTNETDFVTPLDIALGNSDHDQIQLLQSFGAKTGHCVVDNSALVIQHRWKVFKRRFSAADSIYKSNLSDSVSNHEGHDMTKAEMRKNSSSVLEEEEICPVEHVDDGDRRFKKGDDCARDALAVNVAIERGNITDADSEHGSFATDDYFHSKEVDQLKLSVAESINSSKSECRRTDELLKKSENLMKRLEGVLQETRYIGKSEEFKLVVGFSQRLASKQISAKAVCKLPRLPSR